MHISYFSVPIMELKLRVSNLAYLFSKTKSKIFLYRINLTPYGDNMAEDLKLQIAGFHDIEESSMDIVNKNILAHSKKISHLVRDPGILHVTLKIIHEREKSEIYDIHVKLPDKGKVYNTHVTDRNLLAAIDKAMEKIMHEMD
jgi:ribosome-associated translation inhibitor RaiA